jgi:IS5 family transposase
MRKAFSDQPRLDCAAIQDVKLNLNCRDEIIPILAALQHVYSTPRMRDGILRLIAQDVNRDTRRDIGRAGFDDWTILVLAAVRLGCNLNYDKLQDLAEQHRALRHVMGIGDWDEQTSFNWRRIEDTLCLLKTATIDKITEFVVAEGQSTYPEARKKVRGDSFVAETNIHYPTDSSLILDGITKVLCLCNLISQAFEVSGWRQHEHLLKRIKNLAIRIARLSSSKSPTAKERMKEEYRKLLERSKKILQRAEELVKQVTDEDADVATVCQIADLQRFIDLTKQVWGTTYRRTIEGETVPNADKIFSIFETHTQLYRRGKARDENQWGRLVLVYEDAVGFISHYFVLPRDAQDADVVVEQTRIVQERHKNQIEDASFDRGFYSRENEEQLRMIIEHPCLPKKSPKEYAEQQKNASVRFHTARQRHPGIESAIGALQSGNGLERCRDRTEIGFERYIALGILGRNLHVLGKLLIQQRAPKSKSAESRRKPAA